MKKLLLLLLLLPSFAFADAPLYCGSSRTCTVLNTGTTAATLPSGTHTLAKTDSPVFTGTVSSSVDSTTTPLFNAGSGSSVSAYDMAFGGGRFMWGYDASWNSSAGAGVLNLGTNKGMEVFCNGTNSTFLTGTLCEVLYPSGLHQMTGIQSIGTTFTISGCSTTSLTGGATAGKFTSGTAGICTAVVTLGGLTATNGWACWANDLTTTSDTIKQTATSTTTATIAGITASGDIINFGCIGY